MVHMCTVTRLFFLPGRLLDWTTQSRNPVRVAARAGQAAHGDGLPLDSCPHAMGASRVAWRQGWQDAEDLGPVAF